MFLKQLAELLCYRSESRKLRCAKVENTYCHTDGAVKRIFLEKIATSLIQLKLATLCCSRKAVVNSVSDIAYKILRAEREACFLVSI